MNCWIADNLAPGQLTESAVILSQVFTNVAQERCALATAHDACRLCASILNLYVHGKWPWTLAQLEAYQMEWRTESRMESRSESRMVSWVKSWTGSQNAGEHNEAIHIIYMTVCPEGSPCVSAMAIHLECAP